LGRTDCIGLRNAVCHGFAFVGLHMGGKMMEIVERLRQEIGGYTDAHLEKAETDMREAADKIERLRVTVDDLAKENWRFRRALERIVDREEEIDPKTYAELVLMGKKE